MKMSHFMFWILSSLEWRLDKIDNKLKKMKDEAKIAYAIGADGYNFHCGSNQNSTEEGYAGIGY